MLAEAAEQQPTHARLFQRGRQWLRQQARAATQAAGVATLAWRGNTADLLEVGYALVDAQWRTSATGDCPREQVVAAFAHLFGKSVPNPAQRLAKRAAKRRVPRPAAAQPVAPIVPRVDRLATAGAVPATSRGTFGERLAREWPLATRASLAPPERPTSGEDAWREELRTELRLAIAEALSAHPAALATPAAAPPDELLTLPQAAAQLAVCRQTLHDWIRRGLLPAHKLGRRTYIKRSELLLSPCRQERSRKPATSTSSKRAAAVRASSPPISSR